MIVETSGRIKNQLDAIVRLELAQQEAKVLSEVNKRIQDVRFRGEKLSDFFMLIRERLSEQVRAGLQAQIREVLEAANLSRHAFEEQRNQIPALTQLDSKMQRVYTEVVTAWRNYVAGQVAPLTAKLNLVRSLPELRPQLPQLNELERQLNQNLQVLPTPARLQDFDQKLAQLDTLLSRVEGISPAILLFLQKVGDNRATVADLNEEVLNWCLQGDRALAFRITFRS